MRAVAVIAIALVLLVGATSAHAEGVVPAEGSWSGESSAGLPIHFGVENGDIVYLRFKFKWGFCGTFEAYEWGARAAIDSNGHWSFPDPRGQTVEGTFLAPDRVEGTIVSVGRMLPSCPQTEATFTAAPVPSNPENFFAARTGIEALPYEIEIRQQESQGVLIGRVHGSLGETFRFYLFVNRRAPRRLEGNPGFQLHGPHRNIHPGLVGGKLANTDELWSTLPRRTDSKAQRQERRQILAAVADTVCLRQTGQACSR